MYGFPGNARCFGAANGIPFAYGGTVTVDAEGNLVASSASEVIHWSPERGLISSYTFEDMKPNEALHGIATLLQDSNGTSLVGIGFAGKGMGLQQLRDGSASTFTAAGLNGSSLDPESLLRDRPGSLWIGTFTTGLYRAGDSSTEHFTTQDGLSGDSVRNILDRNENVLVFGNPGSGKTHMLQAISQELVRRGRRMLFTNLRDAGAGSADRQARP